MKKRFSRAELIRHLRAALSTLPGDLSYAICGATALAAHGYRRFTRDVDMFVLEHDLNPQSGYQPMTP